MNQTNFITRRFQLELAHSSKSILLTLGCVLMMIVLGTATSSAQTISDVDATTSDHVISLIEGEIGALETELKNPSSSFKTDYNNQLVVYYNSVVTSWKDGADFKDEIKDIDYILQHTSHDAAAVLHPNGQVNLLSGTDVLELYSLVQQLDIEDGDDSDLQAVFNFWRTVKNR